MVQDEIKFYGHPNILSLHPKSFELTKDTFLTLRGDCIVGVSADKACYDIDEKLKNMLMQSETIVVIEIAVGNYRIDIKARGDSRLSLTHKHDMVFRKSTFACPRTASVSSTASSLELPREMVYLLKDSNTKGLLRISAE